MSGDADSPPIRPLSLYQLTDELEALEDDLIASGGEITDEMNERYDRLLEMEADKVEGYIAMIRKFEASEEAIKAERKRLQKAERSMRRSADNLKDRLAAAMRRRSEEAHETRLGKVRLQQAPQRSVVVDVPADQLPDGFKRIKTSADRRALADALASDDVDLRAEAEAVAHFDAPNYYVRIY